MREEIPEIRLSMHREIGSFPLQPFLSKLPLWLDFVVAEFQKGLMGSFLLLHHSLRADVEDRFLECFSKRLALQLVEFDHWLEHKAAHPRSLQVPLVLAQTAGLLTC